MAKMSKISHQRIDVHRITFNAIAMLHRHENECSEEPLNEYFKRHWTLQYGGWLANVIETDTGITLDFGGPELSVHLEFDSERDSIDALRVAPIEAFPAPRKSPRHPQWRLPYFGPIHRHHAAA